MLIVWGTNDPFFTVEGAKAYQRLIDTGYSALEDFERVYCGAYPRISRVICDLRLQHRVRRKKREMPFPENSTVVVAHGAWADDVIVEAARESLFLVPLQISRGEIV